MTHLTDQEAALIQGGKSSLVSIAIPVNTNVALLGNIATGVAVAAAGGTAVLPTFKQTLISDIYQQSGAIAV